MPLFISFLLYVTVNCAWGWSHSSQDSLSLLAGEVNIRSETGVSGGTDWSGAFQMDALRGSSFGSGAVPVVSIRHGVRRKGRPLFGSFIASARTCDICGKVFSDANGCRRHRRSHLSDAQFMYTCPFCPYRKFYRKDMLTSHLRNGHKLGRDEAASLAEGRS